MTIKEFIDYMTEEIERGEIAPDAKLFAERQEETGEVEGYSKDDNGNAHITVEW